MPEKDETEDLAAELGNLTVKETCNFVAEPPAENAKEKAANKEEEPVAPPPALVKIAALLETVDNILVLTGAGVSVSAGIPDFRTPGTGLYDNLAKYKLPYAEAVFDIGYYQYNQQPFVQLASELWPCALDANAPKPTLTHTFVSLLHDKKRLLRNYSQNIDGLEHMANIPEEKLVECHGHFRTASCISCRTAADIVRVRETVVVEKKTPTCKACKKPVKPDIVFFGEQLPPRFHTTLPNDVERADLCLILGTSLNVPPVARIPDMVSCKRVLLNRELVGTIAPTKNDNSRDFFHAGDCDESVVALAKILGWESELLEKHEQCRIDLKIAQKEAAKAKKKESDK